MRRRRDTQDTLQTAERMPHRPGSAPTRSTSIRSTGLAPRPQVEETMEALHDIVRPGRSATSAAPPCTPGSSPNFNMPPSCTAGPRSCRCKISTTCSDGKTCESCCPCVPTWASVPCRTPSGQRTSGSSLGRTVEAFQRGQGRPVLRLPLDEPVVNAVQRLAEARARAWLRLRWRGCWPVPSSPRPLSERPSPHHLQEAVAALELHLSEDEMQSLRSPTPRRDDRGSKKPLRNDVDPHSDVSQMPLISTQGHRPPRVPRPGI